MFPGLPLNSADFFFRSQIALLITSSSRLTLVFVVDDRIVVQNSVVD